MNRSTPAALFLLAVSLSPSLYAATAADSLSAGLAGQTPAMPVPAVSAPARVAPARDVMNEVFSLFGEPLAPGAAGAYGKSLRETIFSVALAPIRDNYLRTDAAFTTGKGTKVSVSLAKAANCEDGGTDCEGKDKAVITLMTSAGQSFLIRGMDIANFSFIYSGSRTVEIDGEKYKVKLYAKPLNPENSEIEVKGPGGRGLTVTMKRLSETLIDKCVAFRLSRDYRMAYATEVMQDGGNARFTQRTQLIVYPFPMTEKHEHTVLSTGDIKASGTSFSNFEPGYTFSIKDGVLEIARI